MSRVYNGMSPISYKFIASGAFQRFAKAGLYELAMYRKDAGISPGEYNNLKGMDVGDWGGKFVRVPIVIDHQQMAQPLVIEECVMSVTTTKNIVKTVVQGLSGTVKEFICDGDYEITMECAVIATDADGNTIDEYPVDGINAIVEMCKIQDSLEVASEFLRDVFGITNIVIQGYTVVQQTYSNRQEIRINAISDTEYLIRSEQI